MLVIIITSVYIFNSTHKVEATGSSSVVSGTATITNMPDYTIYFSGVNANGGSVQYDPSTGFSGNAWSPEYGWVNFSGWTATVPSFEYDSESTDWATGQISLNASDINTRIAGTSYGGVSPIGVTVANDGTVSGYAWGGNVLGWIDFSGVTVGSIPLVPSCTLTSTGDIGGLANSWNISWYTTNFAIGVPVVCSTTGGSTGWPLHGRQSSGVFSTGALSTPPPTYNMLCLGTDGTTATCSVDVVSTPLVAYGCNTTGQCVLGGSGSSCASSDDCTIQQYHNTCVNTYGLGKICSTVSGPGEDNCNDCVTSAHLGCHNNSCELLPGAGASTDGCQNLSDSCDLPPPPTPSNNSKNPHYIEN